jgi:membrane-anchored protein YejM (alkaline phosphatase superfamily)
VARWIEPTFEHILRSTDRSEPIFGFINFCDAHEPYFPWPDEVGTPELLWRSMRMRQDRPGWLARTNGNGHWDLPLLHRLYRASIRSIDHRIQRIVESLRRHGRWDNTLFIITSDHGQAFGEKGMMYHRFRVDDSMIRVPLWVRFPQSAHANRRATGWASLVDVVPTVLDAVGNANSYSVSGKPLSQLIDRPRPEPVFAIADGTMGERWIPPARLAELDRVAVAVFNESVKVTYTTAPDEYHAYDILQDTQEEKDRWSEREGRLSEWSGLAKDTAGRLVAGPQLVQSPELVERLRGWGYA